MRFEYKLNDVVETIGLLYSSMNVEEVELTRIEGLNELGIDGEAFCKKHMKVHDTYVKTFKENMVKYENMNFYFKHDSQIIMLIIAIIFEYEEELINGDTVLVDELKKDLIDGCKNGLGMEIELDDLTSLERIVEVLQDSCLSENEKWVLMQILLEPIKHYNILRNIIIDNIEIYKKALSVVEKDIKPLISEFKEKKNEIYNFMKSFGNVLEEEGIYYVSLAFPTETIILSKKGFIGLICPNFILSKDMSISKEGIIKSIKAISDKTRLDIMTSLKECPKYNLELASKLGISAPTISHHMNILLVNNLVSILKENGKVYYYLNKEEINKIINSLESLLL